ncbi:MAG: hypothetical protein IPL62_12745 [Caulobacteraceae bacterium]|nr:hypothetical protein [Caulobacteraceae bacterium]
MDIVSYANIFTFGGIGIELRVTPFAAKFGEISDDTFTSIEGIIGTSADDRLEMDNNANYIDGGAGNDVLNGFGGIDTIYGGAGVDISIRD